MTKYPREKKCDCSATHYSGTWHEVFAGLGKIPWNLALSQSATVVLRLKEAGILPIVSLDHGLTTSFYYRDPDGNQVEMQVANFGDWAKSSDFMRNELVHLKDPLGQPIDPDQLVAARPQGLAFSEIHRRAFAGEYSPTVLPYIPSAE